MLITKYLYDNASEFVLNNAVISGNKAQLGLIDHPNQIFQQPFDDDSGFTYNAARSEFVSGLVRQVDQTAANSILGAKYSSLNANWNKQGSTTAVLNGTPTIVSGRLQCFGAHGVRYPVTNTGQGAIKFIYRPNYTGAPATNINMCAIINDANNNSRLQLTHSPSGDSLRIQLIDNASATILNVVTIGASPSFVANTDYEIELNWDNVAGTVRVFINGALHGTLSPGAWTHGTGAGRLHLGAYTVIYNVADASFDNLIFFNAVQHTIAYTPGYTIPDTIYFGSVVSLPNFTYTGLGTIQAVEDSNITETGEPRYIIAGLYWDGSSWVISDGTYDQANSSSTVISNLTELDVSGASEVPVSIIFDDTNVLSSVDLISVTVTGQKFAPLGTVETLSPIIAKDISVFDSTENAPANTEVKHIILVDDVAMRWDGSAWVGSNGSSSQANSAADIASNIGTLIDDIKEVKLRTLLITTSNTATPEISESSFTYDFGALAPTDPTKSNVYGFIVDIEGNPIEGATVKVRPDRSNVEYREASSRLIGYELSRLTDDEGFFSFNLIRSSEFEVAAGSEMKYQLEVTLPDETVIQTVGGNVTTFVVPDQSSTNITNQITGV